MKLDLKKISDIRLMIIRSQLGDQRLRLLYSAELQESLASGGVLSELLELADATLAIRSVYLASPPARGALTAMASLGGAAYRAMLDLDVLEDAARRAEGVVPITRKRRPRV